MALSCCTHLSLPSPIVCLPHHPLVCMPGRIDDAIVSFLLSIRDGRRAHIAQREPFERHAARLRFLLAVTHQPRPVRVPSAARVHLAGGVAEHVNARRAL